MTSFRSCYFNVNVLQFIHETGRLTKVFGNLTPPKRQPLVVSPVAPTLCTPTLMTHHKVTPHSPTQAMLRHQS